MYSWIGKLTAHERICKTLARIFELLPKSVSLFFLTALAHLFYFCIPSLRKQIQRNMKDILSDKSEKEIHQECRRYYVHLFVILSEIFFHTLQDKQLERFEVKGEGYLRQALQEGKGAIVYTLHLGNFFYYYWYLSRRYPCLTVVTAGSPELRPIYLLFQEMGCKGLDYDHTPPLALLRELRDHLQNNGVVFLLGDFWRPNFPKAHFFDRITRTPQGTAVLAIEQQVPVIPFYGYRKQGYQHELVFHPSLYLHEKYDKKQREEATNELNRILERIIKEQPSSWFYWFNVDERWEKEP
ncbi:lysophospholipid acyltransferase family protein [Thermoflavimicrobium dichotomicum]|uniref:KDO2-lipid IV(A) lauroyltransferase n=1 Tax=Thermoflavimicrobium dichotomicum TaxID=46223 RepID=A0A1I3P5M0_9BACL|nr:lipid A biosynthesis acyltransferase [Thermoflavimicrobium dichotomicum]SFJ16834.1 KDO2-lipid IV(A) lauroyltransferase [Thermoflavimicrobium dichotomicum]